MRPTGARACGLAQPATRPREVPVEKPSAAQDYVPSVLLRQEDAQDAPRRRRWLPNERLPGTSKHAMPARQRDVMQVKVDTSEQCSEAQVAALQALEDEVAALEGEMDSMVEQFYVAAAGFSAQATAHQTLLRRLRERSQHQPSA